MTLIWIISLCMLKGVISRPLIRRGSGPIYGPLGRPILDDIAQKMEDCGFVSVMAAAINIHPDWISSKIAYTGQAATIDQVTVTVYEPETFKQLPQIVTWDENELANDNSGPVWWPGAVARAAIESGMPHIEGELVSILPSTAFETILGLPATWVYNNASMEDFWAGITGTMDKGSPVIVQSYPTYRKTTVWLEDNHAWAVLEYSGTGEGRLLKLFNPWGFNETITLAQAYSDIWTWHRLTNFDTWTPRPQTQVPPQVEAESITATALTPPAAPSRIAESIPEVQAARPGPGPVDSIPSPAPVQVEDDDIVWITEVVTVYAGAK